MRNQASPASSGSSAANLAAMFMVGRTSGQTPSGSRKVTATASSGGTFTTGNRGAWQATNHATRVAATSPYKCSQCKATLKVVAGGTGPHFCQKCASAGVTVRHTTATAAHSATAQRHAARIAALPAVLRQAALQQLRANNPALAARVVAAMG